MKIHNLAGCCGMSCGICPRFHTNGKSKCLGCGFDPHCSYCSIIKCANVRNSFETCAECSLSPCEKIKNLADWKGFDTNKRWIFNINEIQRMGLEEWLEEQEEKKTYLEAGLKRFNDGRQKNFLCLHFLMMDIDKLRDIVDKSKNIADEDVKIRVKRFKELVRESIT